jgi:PAS domain S-box-containing protein
VKHVERLETAERSERRRDDWARALFEGIDDAVFVHDLQGRILEVNPAACQRLGYTRAEMLQLTTRDIDDPEFAAGFADRLQQQLAQGQLRCEGRHRTKDGRIIPVDINSSAIEIDGVPAVLAVMRDISARKRGEEALRKQTELLQSVLNNMGDAVLVADDRLNIIVYNPAAARLFGAGTPNQPPLTGDGPYGLFLPDMVTRFPVEELPLERSIRGEAVDDVEMFSRHAGAPDGFWVSVSARPLKDEHGVVRGGLSVCRDITERKRAERRQAALYAVTRTLADAATLAEAVPQVLRHICGGLGWDVGGFWVVDASGKELRCVDMWTRDPAAFPEFVEASRQRTFPPGVGLPGRVWSGGRPAWITDVGLDLNFPRAPFARRCGLRSGYAFPIRRGAQTVGVIEAFNRTAQKPDEQTLSLMASLGSQIGQFLERQRVEQALRESEAFYHSLVESLPQNIFRKDRDGRVTFGNHRYLATLKRPLAELMGKTDFDLFPPGLAAKYRADDERIMASGQTEDIIEAHQLPDGTQIYVQVIKTPIHDQQGNVIGIQGMFWDVTERKQAEEAVAESERRYRQLTEATLDAIIVADCDGRITLFNPAAERIFGYRAAEVVGQPLTLLMPERYHAEHRRGFERFLKTRVPHLIGKTVEIHGRRKDGTEVPLELGLSAFELGGNGGLQFLGAIRDLTERNRIRAVLVQNEKLASIGLLSAGVAHEINNPLAFVANNLAVLDRDLMGLMALMAQYEALGIRFAEMDPAALDRIRELAEEIDLEYVRENLPRLLVRTREGVDRVTRIVHSLRGLARTDTPRRQDTYLPDLIETSLEMIRGRMKRRGIEVETEYDPVSRVRCVSTQISQVLLNLLVNALQAIEATHRKEGKIVVRTRRTGDDMLIEVADTGCGIDPDHLPKLFDPFFTTKDVGEGTGLGLSISHNIVTGHGGRIEVESTPGEGSCFRIYLPLHPPRETP